MVNTRASTWRKKRKRPALQSFFNVSTSTCSDGEEPSGGDDGDSDFEEPPSKRMRVKSSSNTEETDPAFVTVPQDPDDPQYLLGVPEMFLNNEQRKKQRALRNNEKFKSEQQEKSELHRQLNEGKSQYHGFFFENTSTAQKKRQRTNQSKASSSSSLSPNNDRNDIDEGLMREHREWSWGTPFHIRQVNTIDHQHDQDDLETGPCIPVPFHDFDAEAKDTEPFLYRFETNSQRWFSIQNQTHDDEQQTEPSHASSCLVAPSVETTPRIPSSTRKSEIDDYLNSDSVQNFASMLCSRYKIHVSKIHSLLEYCVSCKFNNAVQETCGDNEIQTTGEPESLLPKDLSGMLWTEAYRPSRASHICGNRDITSFLSSWFSNSSSSRSSTNSVSNHTKRKKKPSHFTNAYSSIVNDHNDYGDNDNGDDHDRKSAKQKSLMSFFGAASAPAQDYDVEERLDVDKREKDDQDYDPFCDMEDFADEEEQEEGMMSPSKNHSIPRNNAALLCGLPGTGKTCSVYCIAAETGLQVIEINSSVNRSSSTVLKTFEEATQSHSIFKCKQNKDFYENHDKKKTVQSHNHDQNNPRIILVDEADIAFEQDKSFISGLQKLISTSKCPVILTCNDSLHVPLSLKIPKYRFTLSNCINEVYTYMMTVLWVEGWSIDPAMIEVLCSLHNFDMRSLLLLLQYCAQHHTSRPRNWNTRSMNTCDDGSTPLDGTTLMYSMLSLARFGSVAKNSKWHALTLDYLTRDVLGECHDIMDENVLDVLFHSYLVSSQDVDSKTSKVTLNHSAECCEWQSMADRVMTWSTRIRQRQGKEDEAGMGSISWGRQTSEFILSGALHSLGKLKQRHVVQGNQRPLLDDRWGLSFGSCSIANPRLFVKHRQWIHEASRAIRSITPWRVRSTTLRTWHAPMMATIDRLERQRKIRENKRRFFHYLTSFFMPKPP